MSSPTRPRRQPIVALLLGLLLAAGPLFFSARPAFAAATFTVTSTGDQADNNLADRRCDVSAQTGNQCTLRAAIQEANAGLGPGTIRFNIPGPPNQVKTLRPASPLPTITEQVTIDGYSQPGSTRNTTIATTKGTNAAPRIQLDGTLAGIGPFVSGLTVQAPNTVVQGLVINRFDGIGIEVSNGATGARIEGCFLGTDPNGTAPLGNASGVFVHNGDPDTRIGGADPAARNLIAGNRTQGVAIIGGAGVRVLGNLIGTTRTGGGDLANGGHGVDVPASASQIGGTTPGEANVIAFNRGDGVRVRVGSGNRILRNSIFANAGLGIDLITRMGEAGPTPNDLQDIDTGPNSLQNYPVIATATGTRVEGTLNSTPNQDFVLRLFSNPGSGDEGKVFAAGPLTVTTDADGDASFAFTPTTPIPAGRSVTATATNSGGNTSEFSAAVPVGAT